MFAVTMINLGLPQIRTVDKTSPEFIDFWTQVICRYLAEKSNTWGRWAW